MTIQELESVYGNECERFYCMFSHDKYFQTNEGENEAEEGNDKDDEQIDTDSVSLSEIEPVVKTPAQPNSSSTADRLDTKLTLLHQPTRTGNILQNRQIIALKL